MSVAETDVDRLVGAIGSQLPAEWMANPGGWPGQIEAALLDAVLSIRANYGQPGNGVRAAVARYRLAAGARSLDDLTVLADYTTTDLTELLDNRQRTGGVLKAQATIAAAASLVDAGVRHADDLDSASADHRRAYCATHGLGPVTWHYFTMLLGHPDAKADTWLIRFTEGALGRRVDAEETRALVLAAAQRLNRSATALDHAIWAYIRARG